VRGAGRDDVRLLVSRGCEPPLHATFRQLPDFLEAGDLLVVNTSATVAASLDAVAADGTAIEVHLSNRLPSGLWLVELRRPRAPASLPAHEDRSGTTLELPAGGRLRVLARYRGSKRLWLAVPEVPVGPLEYLARHGRPIRYRHVVKDWPLSAYQTVFAREPGSAEMPSAARAMTSGMVTELVSRGIGISPVLLHTGVSSLEGNESPYPERYVVPTVTADRVNHAHDQGNRVIAVGTTAVRALETVADPPGRARPGSGWTDLVVTPERGVRTVDGLLTGWHEPEASHLLMLEAVAGREVLEEAYRAALEARYRWHEFGDAHLILPA
jgi:S-adenosylmethionine:tRNA ribosyltransferase-isomerase